MPSWMNDKKNLSTQSHLHLSLGLTDMRAITREKCDFHRWIVALQEPVRGPSTYINGDTDPKTIIDVKKWEFSVAQRDSDRRRGILRRHGNFFRGGGDKVSTRRHLQRIVWKVYSCEVSKTWLSAAVSFRKQRHRKNAQRKTPARSHELTSRG